MFGSWSRLEDNIKIDIKETVCQGLDRMQVAQKEAECQWHEFFDRVISVLWIPINLSQLSMKQGINCQLLTKNPGIRGWLMGCRIVVLSLMASEYYLLLNFALHRWAPPVWRVNCW